MISQRLRNSVVCVSPGCRASISPGSVLEPGTGGALECPRCGLLYAWHPEGYIDLMPRAEGGHSSLYVSHEAEFAETLDYKRIGIPLLGAGVRQRAIRRMLELGLEDRLIDLGCGNGKFVFWNRRAVQWAVGVDPAPLFAHEALAGVDLCLADARLLPFSDGAFTAALSIDVLEHLPLPDLEQYLREARRVLSPGGRIFIFSNTREGSRLDFVVRGARILSRRLGEMGVLDDVRDRLRKSDHVKAIETYPELERLLERCGFKVQRVIFWNGLFQSLIENLLVKLAESALRRARTRGGQGKRAGEAQEGGEDSVRSSMRSRLARRGPAYRAMRLLTELMWLDLALFGAWRAGPYFLLARRMEAE